MDPSHSLNSTLNKVKEEKLLVHQTKYTIFSFHSIIFMFGILLFSGSSFAKYEIKDIILVIFMLNV